MQQFIVCYNPMLPEQVKDFFERRNGGTSSRFSASHRSLQGVVYFQFDRPLTLPQRVPPSSEKLVMIGGHGEELCLT